MTSLLRRFPLYQRLQLALDLYIAPWRYQSEWAFLSTVRALPDFAATTLQELVETKVLESTKADVIVPALARELTLLAEECAGASVNEEERQIKGDLERDLAAAQEQATKYEKEATALVGDEQVKAYMTLEAEQDRDRVDIEKERANKSRSSTEQERTIDARMSVRAVKMRVAEKPGTTVEAYARARRRLDQAQQEVLRHSDAASRLVKVVSQERSERELYSLATTLGALARAASDMFVPRDGGVSTDKMRTAFEREIVEPLVDIIRLEAGFNIDAETKPLIEAIKKPDVSKLKADAAKKATDEYESAKAKVVNDVKAMAAAHAKRRLAPFFDQDAVIALYGSAQELEELGYNAVELLRTRYEDRNGPTTIKIETIRLLLESLVNRLWSVLTRSESKMDAESFKTLVLGISRLDADPSLWYASQRGSRLVLFGDEQDTAVTNPWQTLACMWALLLEPKMGTAVWDSLLPCVPAWIRSSKGLDFVRKAGSSWHATVAAQLLNITVAAQAARQRSGRTREKRSIRDAFLATERNHDEDVRNKMQSMQLGHETKRSKPAEASKPMDETADEDAGAAASASAGKSTDADRELYGDAAVDDEEDSEQGFQENFKDTTRSRTKELKLNVKRSTEQLAAGRTTGSSEAARRVEAAKMSVPIQRLSTQRLNARLGERPAPLDPPGATAIPLGSRSGSAPASKPDGGGKGRTRMDESADDGEPESGGLGLPKFAKPKPAAAPPAKPAAAPPAKPAVLPLPAKPAVAAPASGAGSGYSQGGKGGTESPLGDPPRGVGDKSRMARPDSDRHGKVARNSIGHRSPPVRPTVSAERRMREARLAQAIQRMQSGEVVRIIDAAFDKATLPLLQKEEVMFKGLLTPSLRGLRATRAVSTAWLRITTKAGLMAHEGTIEVDDDIWARSTDPAAVGSKALAQWPRVLPESASQDQGFDTDLVQRMMQMQQIATARAAEATLEARTKATSAAFDALTSRMAQFQQDFSDSDKYRELVGSHRTFIDPDSHIDDYDRAAISVADVLVHIITLHLVTFRAALEDKTVASAEPMALYVFGTLKFLETLFLEFRGTDEYDAILLPRAGGTAFDVIRIDNGGKRRITPQIEVKQTREPSNPLDLTIIKKLEDLRGGTEAKFADSRAILRQLCIVFAADVCAKPSAPAGAGSGSSSGEIKKGAPGAAGVKGGRQTPLGADRPEEKKKKRKIVISDDEDDDADMTPAAPAKAAEPAKAAGAGAGAGAGSGAGSSKFQPGPIWDQFKQARGNLEKEAASPLASSGGSRGDASPPSEPPIKDRSTIYFRLDSVNAELFQGKGGEHLGLTRTGEEDTINNYPELAKIAKTHNWRSILSNMWTLQKPLEYEVDTANDKDRHVGKYAAAEHAYHAGKFPRYPKYQRKFEIDSGSPFAKDPKAAKAAGGAKGSEDAGVVADLEGKDEMLELVQMAKFQQDELARKVLLATNDAVLTHSTRGKPKVEYGLMRVRDRIREQYADGAGAGSGAGGGTRAREHSDMTERKSHASVARGTKRKHQDSDQEDQPSPKSTKLSDDVDSGTDSEDETGFVFSHDRVSAGIVGSDSSVPSVKFPPQRDFGTAEMKPDADKRPILVTDNSRCYLETWSSHYRQATDFLIAVAEPVARPERIHEYQITKTSLYAAASLGLTTDNILAGFALLAKNVLPKPVKRFIQETTQKCGKIKMVLRRNRYFIESADIKVLSEIAKDAVVAAARLDADFKSGALTRETQTGMNLLIVTSAASAAIVLQGTATKKPVSELAAAGLETFAESKHGGDADIGLEPTFAIEIDSAQMQEVRRHCTVDLGYPMLEEYDFRRDTESTNLPIDLRASTTIRDYQEKSLAKMFGNGRARSGIIVLPCGAGKTLVGITAAQTIGKSTLIYCTTAVAVEQWKRQVLQWTNLPSKYIATFTATSKEAFRTDSLVVITTYSMVAFSGKRSAASEAVMKQITGHEWGLVLLDEVHVAPANKFRRCVSLTHSKCKLGLTATLVREDDLIDDLFFLVGPKLYEANWLDLQAAGYLATVQCIEVRCPMTAEFARTYLSEKNSARQRLLYTMNPNKFVACQYLIRQHERRGDKILVFSDNVFALATYARLLNVPYIYGGTPDAERIELFKQFQINPRFNCLFISKVGDASIDLPDVSVVIQISSHFASRRQEAQRIGRILRPKPKETGRFNAFFYSLVSSDTKEMVFAGKRQRFLVDQGYAFKVITELKGMDQEKDLLLTSSQDQRELLSRVMAEDSKQGDVEDDNVAELEDDGADETKRVGQGERKTGSTSKLSGADDRMYLEFKGESGLAAQGGLAAPLDPRKSAARSGSAKGAKNGGKRV